MQPLGGPAVTALRDAINHHFVDIIGSMKQMIVRVDDELHAQLKARATAEGRSLNDLMTATLAAAVEVGTTRRTIRTRARLAGRIVVPDAPRRVPTRKSALTATSGLGRAASEALSAERDDR